MYQTSTKDKVTVTEKFKPRRPAAIHIHASVHIQLQKMCEHRGLLLGDLVERLIRAEYRKTFDKGLQVEGKISGQTNNC